MGRSTRQHACIRSRLILVIDIVDRRLGARGQRDNPLAPTLDQATNATIGAEQGGAALAFGFGLEQIGELRVDPK